MFLGGGYLFGLAVKRDHQKLGIGGALTQAQIERVRRNEGLLMVALVMFWNARFFRHLGFASVKRTELPSSVSRLADFRSPLYIHSAVMSKRVKAVEV
jgi:predicted N-acetyltransferase YhbS